MEQLTVTLRHKASKVNSERYDADDKDALVRSIYISKAAFQDGESRPDEVTLTITS